MTNGPDRRHTNSEAPRRRREKQQPLAQPHDARPDHLSERFAQALGALIDASLRLPVCDRAAKLSAGLDRLSNATDKSAACEASRALLTASEQALEEDPWFRFHQAATAAAATLCEAA